MNEGNLQQIPLARIMRSRWQPRDEKFDAEALWGLAQSIQQTRLINAIVVFPMRIAEDDPEPWYELVAGERRSRALVGLALGKALDNHTPKEYVERLACVGLAGLGDQERRVLEESGATIRAMIESDDDLVRLHSVAVIENLERQSLSPLEEARALQGLLDENGCSQRELARRIGKSQSYVTQTVGLLGLAPVAQEAVSTRALTATHARAIARVPAPLQPAVTEWATAAVSRNDTPATTRQVANRARQVAAFVDPDRWLPNGELVYSPADRNRLAMMRWAVEQCDVEQQAEALLGLAECGYAGPNLLAKKPIQLVSGSLREALQALGLEGVRQAWSTFAEETGRSCESCILGGVSLALDEDLHAYCPRWSDDEITSCEKWIGVDDPVVLPISIRLAEYLAEEVGREFETEPFNYLLSVEDYVAAYEQFATFTCNEREERERQKSQQHIDDILQFFDWQLDQPNEALEHFQAHYCFKCVHRTDESPPCRFVDGSLTDWSGPIAPEFGVLVTEGGMMLPRCEQFAYADLKLLRLARRAEVEFPPAVAARWLRGIGVAGSGVSSNHSICWGILRWAPYNPPVKGATDWDRLCSWIKRNWDELGGAGGVALLLDVVLSERKLREARKQPFTLLNAVTGEEEQFAVVRFSTVMGKRRYGWTTYPDEWPRPWETDSSDNEN